MKKPPCHRCNAACCKQEHTGYEYAVHLKEDDDLRLFERSILYPIEGGYGVPAIPYNQVTGHCIFLDDATDRCTVYEYRPKVCRRFNCTVGFGVGDEKVINGFLEKNPQVIQIIKLEEREQVKQRRQEHNEKFGL